MSGTDAASSNAAVGGTNVPTMVAEPAFAGSTENMQNANQNTEHFNTMAIDALEDKFMEELVM